MDDRIKVHELPLIADALGKITDKGEAKAAYEGLVRQLEASQNTGNDLLWPTDHPIWWEIRSSITSRE